MRALPTDRMRAFVAALLETGTNNARRAAQMAGYQGDENTLKVSGHRLMHDDRIQAAMVEEGRRRLTSGAILATSQLVTMLEDPDKRIRLKAIDMTLNRIGLHNVNETRNVNETIGSDDELVGRIMRLAQSLGMDPALLLGQQMPKPIEINPPVIDAEFEIVGSTEGLEDIL